MIFLFMLFLFFYFLFLGLYITHFGPFPDSIKLHENQAENLSWNLVPRPISILCSPAHHYDMIVADKICVEFLIWMLRECQGNFT